MTQTEQIRKKYNVGLAEFAEMLHVTRQQVHKWETERAAPSRMAQHRIAEVEKKLSKRKQKTKSPTVGYKPRSESPLSIARRVAGL